MRKKRRKLFGLTPGKAVFLRVPANLFKEPLGYGGASLVPFVKQSCGRYPLQKWVEILTVIRISQSQVVTKRVYSLDTIVRITKQGVVVIVNQ